MNFNISFLVLVLAVIPGCTLSAKTTESKEAVPSFKVLHCQDEYTVKHNMADSGIDLLLEQNEGSREYMATLTKLGYVGTRLKKITVKSEFLEKDQKIIFSGEELKLSLSLDSKRQPKDGALEATDKEAQKKVDSKRIWPINMKMICKASQI
ncbi:MAG: hypothetical protein AAB966_05170 [Patescibacteria group bacterium]